MSIWITVVQLRRIGQVSTRSAVVVVAVDSSTACTSTSTSTSTGTGTSMEERAAGHGCRHFGKGQFCLRHSESRCIGISNRSQSHTDPHVVIVVVVVVISEDDTVFLGGDATTPSGSAFASAAGTRGHADADADAQSPCLPTRWVVVGNKEGLRWPQLASLHVLL